jgi:hypothetical protein
MAKLIGFVAVVLYGVACYGTMPSQCFTMQHAIECQRVQLNAIKDWRSVNWGTVWSINKI